MLKTVQKTSKNFILTLLFAMMGTFFMAPDTFAASYEVSSPIVMQALLSTGAELKMTSDITLTSAVGINNDATIDLDGHTLDLGNNKFTSYANLVVKDTSSEQSGKITGTAMFTIYAGSNTANPGNLTLESGAIEANGSYGIRNFGLLTINGGLITGNDFVIYNDTNSRMVMNGGKIISRNGIVVQVQTNASFEMNDGYLETLSNDAVVNISKPGAKVVINGGTIKATENEKGAGITIFKDGEITVNGGTITASDGVIIANGSDSGGNDGRNAKITINGGNLTSLNTVAIYAPQVNGENLITGGTITGTTGIEIRNGKLTVTGGTINGAMDTFTSTENSSGSTSYGAAVAVAQHTVARPIIVRITGGNFSAYRPVAITNPQGHDDTSLVDVDLNIGCSSWRGVIFGDAIDNLGEGSDYLEDGNTLAVYNDSCQLPAPLAPDTGAVTKETSAIATLNKTALLFAKVIAILGGVLFVAIRRSQKRQ